MSNPASKEPKVANVPNLRFPGYFDGWCLLTIKNYYEIQMCKRVFASQTSQDESVPFYKIGTLGNAADCYISRELFVEYKNKYSFPNTGETLITCSGTVGRCVQFDGKDSYFQDSNIVWLRPHNSPLTNDFLYRLLDAKDWSHLNTTTISRIYSKDLLSLKFRYPSAKNEQERIVSFFNALDTRIETQNKIIKEKEALRDFNLKRIFSFQGEHKALSSFFSFGKAGGTPNSTNKSYYGGDIPFLSISDVTEQGKYINRTEKTLSELGLRSSSSWLVPAHSLILSMYASVGLPAINEMPLATSQAMFSMVPNNADDLEFLYYYLLYFKKMKLCKYLETGTQSNVNADFVKNIMVPVVDDAKREHIVSVLKGLDDSIELEKKILQKMELQKRYLLRNLFI